MEISQFKVHFCSTTNFLIHLQKRKYRVLILAKWTGISVRIYCKLQDYQVINIFTIAFILQHLRISWLHNNSRTVRSSRLNITLNPCSWLSFLEFCHSQKNWHQYFQGYRITQRFDSYSESFELPIDFAPSILIIFILFDKILLYKIYSLCVTYWYSYY